MTETQNFKKVIRQCKFILVVIALLLFTPSAVSAQSQMYEEEDSVKPAFTIYPAIFELDTNRNEGITETITIENNIDIPIPVKVVIKDYTIDEYGVPDYADNNTDWSPTKWINPTPSEIIIDGLGKREITLKINIPSHAESGSHFATIMFEPVLPDGYFIPGTAHVIAQIGAIIVLNVDFETVERPDILYEIGDFRAYNLLENSPIEYFSFILNNDVFYHKITGDIVIKNIFNKEVSRFEVPQTTLFPKKRRVIQDSQLNKLLFGLYKAEIEVGDDAGQVRALTSFWVYPSFGNTVIFVLVLFIILISIIFRKRVMRAAVIFHSGVKNVLAK